MKALFYNKTKSKVTGAAHPWQKHVSAHCSSFIILLELEDGLLGPKSLSTQTGKLLWRCGLHSFVWGHIPSRIENKFALEGRRSPNPVSKYPIFSSTFLSLQVRDCPQYCQTQSLTLGFLENYLDSNLKTCFPGPHPKLAESEFAKVKWEVWYFANVFQVILVHGLVLESLWEWLPQGHKWF